MSQGSTTLEDERDELVDLTIKERLRALDLPGKRGEDTDS